MLLVPEVEAEFPILAVDGPAGSGKSSAARLLAQALGCAMLASGQGYRALAWAALEDGWLCTSAPAAEWLRAQELYFLPGGEALLRRDIPPLALRTERVSAAASRWAVHAQLRSCVDQAQRSCVERLAGEGKHRGVVVEGRDIASVVFPHARPRFYLQAALEVRARRRWMEQHGAEGQLDEDSLAQVQAALFARDEADTNRLIAPLREDAQAVVLDTTMLSLEETVARMRRIACAQRPVLDPMQSSKENG